MPVKLTVADGYHERCGMLVRALKGDSPTIASMLGIDSPSYRQIISRYRSGTRAIGDGNRLGLICKILGVDIDLVINGPTKDLATNLRKSSPQRVRMINKVILLGNVGQDPECRTTQSGQSVATIRLATSEKYKDKEGNMQERTEWHTVVAWGKTAEIVQKYAPKGKQLYIDGRIQTRKWQDKNGQDRYSTEIVADTIKLLGGNANSGATPRDNTPSPSDNNTTTSSVPFDDEEIPF